MVKITAVPIDNKTIQSADPLQLYKDLYKLTRLLFGRRKVTHGNKDLGEVLVFQSSGELAVKILPKQNGMEVYQDVYFDGTYKIGLMLENRTQRPFSLAALY
jgi:hypothetical protein